MGGPAYHVALLSGRLDPNRYETILVHGELGEGEGSLAGLAEDCGAEVRRVPSLSPEMSPRADPHALAALRNLIRKYKPDIVHTHTAKAGALGRFAAITAGRPRPIIVHTYHGHVLEHYFGRAKTHAYRVIERRLARVSDCLIGVSQATVDDLVRLRVAPREKFRVVPIGLELERFTVANGDAGLAFRDEVGAGPEDVLFAYVGRLVQIKRLDVMLRALARARALGAPARLAVIGDGGTRGDLERLAAGLNLDGAVRFLGFRTDLEAITAGCDAALLTSDSEGTPVFLIEAAAAGRPALATAVGGVADVVRAGNGTLVPRGRDMELAEAIVQLSSDRTVRREMGARAREHVLRAFHADRLLTDIDRLYDDLLASRSLGGSNRRRSGQPSLPTA